MSQTFTSLSQAIIQLENTQWPNNPGALTDGQGNPLQFNSLQEGLDALQNKLAFDASGNSQVYSPNMTLQDFETTYTGGNTQAGSTLASILGVTASTPLYQLSDQNLPNAASDVSTLQKIMNQLGGQTPLGGQSSAIDPNTGNPSQSQPTSYFADIAAVLVGLILIGGAVFSFSQVKDTIVSTAKGVALA